jgi:hypothetical protein
MSGYPAKIIDEQFKALSLKFSTTEIGIGVLWGVYIALNLHYKIPVSLIDFEQRLPELICSECSHNNRQLTVLICQHNRKAVNNKRQLEYYHKTKILRAEWKASSM